MQSGKFRYIPLELRPAFTTEWKSSMAEDKTEVTLTKNLSPKRKTMYNVQSKQEQVCSGIGVLIHCFLSSASTEFQTLRSP